MDLIPSNLERIFTGEIENNFTKVISVPIFEKYDAVIISGMHYDFHFSLIENAYTVFKGVQADDYLRNENAALSIKAKCRVEMPWLIIPLVYDTIKIRQRDLEIMTRNKNFVSVYVAKYRL